MENTGTIKTTQEYAPQKYTLSKQNIPLEVRLNAAKSILKNYMLSKGIDIEEMKRKNGIKPLRFTDLPADILKNVRFFLDFNEYHSKPKTFFFEKLINDDKYSYLHPILADYIKTTECLTCEDKKPTLIKLSVQGQPKQEDNLPKKSDELSLQQKKQEKKQEREEQKKAKKLAEQIRIEEQRKKFEAARLERIARKNAEREERQRQKEQKKLEKLKKVPSKSIFEKIVWSPLAPVLATISMLSLPILHDYGILYRQNKIRELSIVYKEKQEQINKKSDYLSVCIDSIESKIDSVQEISRNKKQKIIKGKDLDWYCSFPIDKIRVVSPYGWRLHPIRKNKEGGPATLFHEGIDLDAEMGDSVRAAKEGIISFVGYKPGYGWTVDITHENGWMTRYAHLSKTPKHVKKGYEIKKNEYFAEVGCSGLSTGDHLHFEIRDNRGNPVNPIYCIKTEEQLRSDECKTLSELDSIISEYNAQIDSLKTKAPEELEEEKKLLEKEYFAAIAKINNSSLIDLLLSDKK